MWKRQSKKAVVFIELRFNPRTYKGAGDGCKDFCRILKKYLVKLYDAETFQYLFIHPSQKFLFVNSTLLQQPYFDMQLKPNFFF